jgi:hypothetical protein
MFLLPVITSPSLNGLVQTPVQARMELHDIETIRSNDSGQSSDRLPASISSLRFGKTQTITVTLFDRGYPDQDCA